MTKQVKILLLTLLFLLGGIAGYFTSCKRTPTEPNDNTKPGRRDYEWAVDTISSPPNLFYLISLWGNSATNLWAVGPADESIYSLWHYDGRIWEKTTQRLSSNLQSIFGFDSSDIWMCDSPGGNIFHFNGTSWDKFGFFPYPEYSLTYLNNIWGPAPNEIYVACSAYDQTKGSKAILMRYNGIKWEFVNLPEKKMSFVYIRKSDENNCLYITAIEFLPNGDTYVIFKYDGNILDEIYSSKEVAYACEIKGKIYIYNGQKIYKHQNNQLVLWKDFSRTNYVGGIYGRSEIDFFGVASDGLAHYNGTDLKTICPTDLFINGLFVMEKDIFMICEYRIIIHGKLKEE